MGKPTIDQRKALQLLAARILYLHQQGLSRDRIIVQLCTEGMDRPLASGVVDRTLRTYGNRRALRTLLSWVGVILIYGAINVVLHYAQEIYYRDDMYKCRLLEDQLKRERTELSRIEDRAKARIDEKKHIEDLELKLKDPQRNYNSEYSYQIDYQRYKKSIARYNSKLALTQSLRELYDSLLAQYNTHVGEYNKLAKAAYARYYLIPVPGGRSKSSSKKAYLR